MLNNKIRFKNKMHILLIVSFISVAIISFFFMSNKAYATDPTDWSLTGYDGDIWADEHVNADEPKTKNRIGIDDIVYNRVPLFDVNVFSSTPGGQEIDPASPLNFFRTLVANWFVLGMNLSLTVMIIIIIYTGIRMALSTLAEKKAEYKEMLFNFVKAIAKIFVLTTIMALVMQISQYLTELFAANGPEVDGEISGKNLYVTMVTRALGSFSFNSKIPAAILFFGLTLTFFKFAYRYTKRMLNVYLLIIIAPVLVAKDAYEGASGKQGKTFSAWLQEFTLNVALQPAHALIYTALVYVALQNGTNNILDFLVAVLIMNFMVSADKIFFKIFNMRFTKGPGAAGAADALTEGVKMYAGVQAAKEGAKLSGKALVGTAKFARNTTRVIGGTAKNVSNKLASMDNETGRKIRQKKYDRGVKKAEKEKQKRLEEDKPWKIEGLADALTGKINKNKRTRYAKKARNQIEGLQNTEERQGISRAMPSVLRNFVADAKNDRAIKSLGKARTKEGGDKNFVSQLAELRSLAKRNDETGRITRKLLKLKRDRDIKKLKYVAGSIAGVAGQSLALFAAPALIAADETDLALMGVTATMGNTSTAIAKHYYYRRNAKEDYIAKRSFEDTLQSLKNANGDLGTLQAKFDAIEAHDRDGRKEVYNQMSAYNELKLNEHTLRAMLNDYMLKHGNEPFDEARLDEMIDKVLSDAGVKELDVNIEAIKTSLKADMLNSHANKINANIAGELGEGTDDETKGKNRFTNTELIDLAKRAVQGEDLTELSNKQICDLVDDALIKAKVENINAVSGDIQKEVLGMVKQQRESKFTESMGKIISEESTYDQIKDKVETTAGNLVRMLAVEDMSEKDKYVAIVIAQLGLAANIKEEERRDLEKKVEEKVKAAILENKKESGKQRIDKKDAISAFAENAKKTVDHELDELGDAAVLSKDVRDAINDIKDNVKHEKTKKGSIGTITDLDRRLRHMRDVL